MEIYQTKALGFDNEPASDTFLNNSDEGLATSPSSNEKSSEKTKPLPNRPMSQTQAFDEENLTEPKGRFLRACHALDAYLARSFLKKEYTWRDYLIRFVPSFIVGILGTLVWRWVTLGWRPWTRTVEERAMWCKSSGFESLFL